jgi:rRNA maturation RNase YbeY
MILNRQRTVRVARPPLELFLRRVHEQLGLNGAEVTICLVTDGEIARMNECFRKKKGPTDVLSFPAKTHSKLLALRRKHATNGAVVATSKCLPGASKGGGRSSLLREGTDSEVAQRPVKEQALAPENDFLGDIAISPATARRNAKKFQRTLPSELQILILHGLLHLLGYDHETDRGQMTRVENRLRRRLGLS